MAITPTPRFLLKKYTAGGDPHPSRTEFNLMIDGIENSASMFSQGVTGARPAAGKVGRWYWDTTVSRMYYDDGVAWQDQNPNGGGGAGAAVIPGATAIEGVSAKAARADHTHTIALATAAVDGAMPKADKSKLDAATDAATASTVMRRDASSRVAVGTPTATGHATTKAYVDGAVTAIGTAAADYADAAITAAPNATGSVAGKMPAADKTKLDAATSVGTASTLPLRDAAGQFSVGTPTQTGHVTRKDYVDAAVNGAKTYADNAVDGIPDATTTVPGLMPAADKTKLNAATAAATPSTLVMTDAAGRFKAANPSATTDVANKTYVDTAVTGAKTYADDAVGAIPAIPLATAAVDGKMPKTDKAKLDAATSAATPSTLVMRASNGRIDTADPVSSGNAATKNYVDGKTWDASDVNTGTFAPARLPAATGSVAGSMSAADKAKLDAASTNATGSTIAVRYADGRLGITTPSNNGDAATKGYVDAQINILKARMDLAGI